MHRAEAKAIEARIQNDDVEIGQGRHRYPGQVDAKGVGRRPVMLRKGYQAVVDDDQ